MSKNYYGLTVLAFTSLYFYLYFTYVNKLGAITYTSILIVLIIWLVKPYFNSNFKKLICVNNILSVLIILTVSTLMVSDKIEGEYIQIALDSILVAVFLMVAKRLAWKKIKKD